MPYGKQESVWVRLVLAVEHAVVAVVVVVVEETEEAVECW
jgi:hypothetical protein